MKELSVIVVLLGALSLTNNLAHVDASSETCSRGGECFLLAMQSVEGCTDGWTLHGLWAQWQNGCQGPQFNESAIEDLMKDLDEYWPSCQGGDESFWSHEWSKHGTCSGLTEHDYFQTAINLCKQYRSNCNGSLDNGGVCHVCINKHNVGTKRQIF